MSLRRIQGLVRNGLYYLTEHAMDEAGDDDCDVFDLEHAILRGHVRRTWPEAGTVEVVGPSLDGRVLGVVCRITAGGKVRIITAYADQPGIGEG